MISFHDGAARVRHMIETIVQNFKSNHPENSSNLTEHHSNTHNILAFWHWLLHKPARLILSSGTTKVNLCIFKCIEFSMCCVWGGEDQPFCPVWSAEVSTVLGTEQERRRQLQTEDTASKPEPSAGVFHSFSSSRACGLQQWCHRYGSGTHHIKQFLWFSECLSDWILKICKYT